MTTTWISTLPSCDSASPKAIALYRMTASDSPWDLQLHQSCVHVLKKLEHADRVRIDRALLELARNPLAGDSRKLKGLVVQNLYRRRTGDWRIFFALNSSLRSIFVLDISRRSSNTY